MHKGRSVSRNSAWLFLSRLTAQGLAVLFIALLARRLGVEGFGQFTFLSALLLIGNTFTNFGTDTLLIRELARAGRMDGLVRGALSLQLLLSVPWILVMSLAGSGLPALVYALALIPMALFSIVTATLRAFERMDSVWTLSLVNGLLQVAAAGLAPTLLTLYLLMLVGQLCLAGVAVYIARRTVPGLKLTPLGPPGPVLRASLPFASLTLLLVLAGRLGLLTVSLQLGDAATGLFSAVARLVDGLKVGHYAVLGALLPVLARGTVEAQVRFRQGFGFLLGMTLVMAFALLVFARPLLLLLYGAAYLPAVPLLGWLGWSLIPYTVSSFISYELIAWGRERWLVQATAIALGILLVLYPGSIALWGLPGAVYAALAGELLQAGVLAFYWQRARAVRTNLEVIQEPELHG